ARDHRTAHGAGGRARRLARALCHGVDARQPGRHVGDHRPARAAPPRRPTAGGRCAHPGVASHTDRCARAPRDERVAFARITPFPPGRTPVECAMRARSALMTTLPPPSMPRRGGAAVLIAAGLLVSTLASPAPGFPEGKTLDRPYDPVVVRTALLTGLTDR